MCRMSTILESDDTGALRLPPSMLPHPGPHRRYHVAAEAGRIFVREVTAEASANAEDHAAWLRRLESIRQRGATGAPATPLQQVFDELREDRR